MLPAAARKSNSTASARSILVTIATSAVLKMVGYLSGLSSPSVTDNSTELPVFERALNHGGFQVAQCTVGILGLLSIPLIGLAVYCVGPKRFERNQRHFGYGTMFFIAGFWTVTIFFRHLPN